jgi:hypothetical protein
MDWSAFFKEYPALIPAVAALLVAVLGFLFGRLTAVESRTFTRRAAVYDMRIQEAREFVEKMGTAINIYQHAFRVMDEESDIKSFKTMFSHHMDEFEKVPLTTNAAIRKKPSIDLLNDKKLSGLSDKLFEKLYSPFMEMQPILLGFFTKVENRADELLKTVREVRRRFEEGEMVDENELLHLEEAAKIDFSDLKQDLGLEKMQSDLREAAAILTQMNARLDKLAAELK